MSSVSHFQFIAQGTLDESIPLFTEVFGPHLDKSRMGNARLMQMREKDTREIVSVAAVEQIKNREWYIWLFATREEFRNKGCAKKFLQEIITFARDNGIRSLSLKTYRHWESMKSLLSQSKWYLCGAEPARRFDQVREVWRLPIFEKPLPVIVIGANPKGRGGEWVEKIMRMPDVYKLAAIVDVSAEICRYWREQGVIAYENAEDALAGQRPEAVIIAVPPAPSAGMQRICARQRLPMLVEKPLANSLMDVVDLQRMYSATAVPLVVGVQRRSHPSYVFFRSQLKSVGEPDEISIQISLGRPDGEIPVGHRSDASLCRGGALLDLGYHALDLAHFLLEQPLEMVSCTLEDSGDLPSGVETSARLLGRAGRTWVKIHVDRHGENKNEEVLARMKDGIYRATREGVWNATGELLYHCPNA